jgi:hypothetical protein
VIESMDGVLIKPVDRGNAKNNRDNKEIYSSTNEKVNKNFN